MHRTAKEPRADPRWEEAVLCLNTLTIGPKFAAAVPFQNTSQSLRGGRPAKYLPVHGPHDAAWAIAEWLVDRLASCGVDELVDGAEYEFDAAFADNDLEIERHDQLLTFLVLYLTSPFGTQARELMPLFSVAFEVWVSRADPAAQTYLHAVRDICVRFEQDH